jgi:hypothetical protein
VASHGAQQSGFDFLLGKRHNGHVDVRDCRSVVRHREGRCNINMSMFGVTYLFSAMSTLLGAKSR